MQLINRRRLTIIVGVIVGLMLAATSVWSQAPPQWPMVHMGTFPNSENGLYVSLDCVDPSALTALQNQIQAVVIPVSTIQRRTLDPLIAAERNSPTTIRLQVGAPGVTYRWHEAHASAVIGPQSSGSVTVFAGTGPLCATGRHEFGSAIISPFGGGFSGPDDTLPGESLCAEFKGVFTIDSAKSGFHWERR